MGDFLRILTLPTISRLGKHRATLPKLNALDQLAKGFLLGFEPLILILTAVHCTNCVTQTHYISLHLLQPISEERCSHAPQNALLFTKGAEAEFYVPDGNSLYFKFSSQHVECPLISSAVCLRTHRLRVMHYSVTFKKTIIG